MSAEPVPQPLAPVIRFRIRTMLTVTTVLAVAAAVAAPYWRAQKPTVQTALLVFWGFCLAFAAIGGWSYWRQSSRVPSQAGRIVEMAWPTGRKRWLPAVGLTSMTVASALTCVVIVTQSLSIAENERFTPAGKIFNAAYRGSCFGFMMGGAVLLFVRKPLYLCEHGIPGSFGFAPWKYIRHAEWLSDRPGVMKLRRLDGDIYLNVSQREREAVEAFVRTKTKFIDAAPTPEPQLTP